MNHNLFINHTIVFGFLLGFLLILPVGSQAVEPEKGTRALQDQRIKQIAAESVQDTLKACLSRIPADSSSGQILLAEQACRQVEAKRREIRLTF